MSWLLTDVTTTSCFPTKLTMEAKLNLKSFIGDVCTGDDVTLADGDDERNEVTPLLCDWSSDYKHAVESFKL